MPINSLVQNLCDEYLKSCCEIESVRPAQNNLVEEAREMEKKTGELRGRPLFFNYIGSGRGNGPYVELKDGSVKIDLINGIGIHILGHSHPEVVKAGLKASLSDVVMQGNLQPNAEYHDISEKLVELGARNSKLKHAWLCQSGSMANENALKACRQKMNGARKIIAMNKAFAGRTTMMAEITDNDNYRVGLPRYDEILRVPFYNPGDANSIETSLNIFKDHIKSHKGDISCFMFEPMQGEGGYTAAPRDFFLPMLEICKEEGIPVFLDEVQTFCRTGEFFAFETLGLGDYVDVVSVAKSLQVGATLYSEELNPKPGLVSGTFSGSTQALASGRKVLDILDSGYMGESGVIQKIHQGFVGMLNELNEGSCKGLVRDAGGLGLMVAFTPFDGSREKMLALVKALFENGVMAFGCGSNPYRLRFLLPVVLEPKHIDEVKAIMEKSILSIKGE